LRAPHEKPYPVDLPRLLRVNRQWCGEQAKGEKDDEPDGVELHGCL
jgi:hypothetical protein